MATFFRNLRNQLSAKFLDIMAVVVAVVAVIISFNQGESQQKIQITSWKPVLSMELMKTDDEPTKGLLLKNIGFGPAEIVSFRYYRDESAYVNKQSNDLWLDSSGKFFLGKDMDSITWNKINFLNPGYVLSSQPGDNHLFFVETQYSIYERQAATRLGKVIVEIRYISVSRLDKDTNYLRFCETFVKNNIRDSAEKHEYEKNAW